MLKNRGFTLIELLVAITIVAILSIIGLTTYLGVQSRARDSQRLDDARKIIIALEQYKSGTGTYPDPGTADSLSGWDVYSGVSTWITGLDTSSFRDAKLPADPQSTQKYYYVSSNGSDYCLQVIQENDVTNHPYLTTKGTAGKWSSGTPAVAVWHLRFGPKGANTGDCNSPGITV